MSRIVVVDDDRNVCETLRETLTRSGHECFVVNDGGGAFSEVKKARPDLVVLDLMMPEVSGFRLCRMIRRDPLLYPVPIMILAVADEGPEILHCIEQGADDCLMKPIAGQEVIRKVRGLLLMRETAAKRDPVTGMYGMEAVKREINHKLARGEAIAACYIEAASPKSVAREASAPGANGAELVRDVAQLISTVAEEMQVYEIFAGHVGGPHFVVVVNLDEHERFCKRFVEKFDSEIARPSGRESLSTQGATRPAPKVSVGVAHNQHRTYRSADRMFQVLGEVQRKARESAESSCFVDRRHVDR